MYNNTYSTHFSFFPTYEVCNNESHMHTHMFPVDMMEHPKNHGGYNGMIKTQQT